MKEVRDLFTKASLRHEAAMGLNHEDWKRYRQIVDGYEKLRRFETREYQLTYETRVEVARKKLIDAAGAKTRGLVPRLLGRDGFDRAAIDRQAHRVVLHNHEQALSRLDEAEIDRINDLLSSALRHQKRQAELKSDFEQATDRRSGIDRRRGPSR